MVVFKDDPQKYNTPEMFLKIQEDIVKVMELQKQILKKEEAIMLNPAVRTFVNTLTNRSIKNVLFFAVR